MTPIDVTAVPVDYLRPTAKELQGTLTEVSYEARNYINASRQLVTNQRITAAEAGRETVVGESINKRCNVYLPAGYDEQDHETKYDVLYLLHGVGGDRYEWLRSNGMVDNNFIVCNLFDNLIGNGDIRPLIVVFPEGRSAVDWTDTSFNAAGTNLLGFYYFDYELRYDLIPFIESNYHTIAKISDISVEGTLRNRRHRALAGLSMGGMQSLNLTLGGYRCDSTTFTGTKPGWSNGLDETVRAPGMVDLFAYVGAFSNAPTSSEGEILGGHIASARYPLQLLYVTCGDADNVAVNLGYRKSVNGLRETAGDSIMSHYEVILKGGVHDFTVWNHGAYNFARLAFGQTDDESAPSGLHQITLDL